MRWRSRLKKLFFFNLLHRAAFPGAGPPRRRHRSSGAMHSSDEEDAGGARSAGLSSHLFPIFVFGSQVFGLLVVVLAAVWFSKFQGGFAWNADPGLEFNYHPVMMTIGLIFLYAEAILVYRIFNRFPKKFVKFVHGALQAGALLFAGIALKAVFDSHNLHNPPIANMYSMHSWLGISTVSLFGLQLMAGFLIFVFPGASDNYRRFYMESHRFFGLGIFVLACATALTGIVEKVSFAVPNYATLPSQSFVVNFYGVSIVVFAFFVVFIATKSEWKRVEPEAEHVPLLNH